MAGVAEERGRCSAERLCCRPQARRCLSLHVTVGEEGDVAGAVAPLSHVGIAWGSRSGGQTGDGAGTQSVSDGGNGNGRRARTA